jgi:hypothetical protein
VLVFFGTLILSAEKAKESCMQCLNKLSAYVSMQEIRGLQGCHMHSVAGEDTGDFGKL